MQLCNAAFEIVSQMVNRHPEAIGAHVAVLVPNLREKLSDSHKEVRDDVIKLCMQLMLEVATPQVVFDMIAPGLKHKTPNVKSSALAILEQIITMHGDKSVKIGPHMKTICGMMADRDGDVRPATLMTPPLRFWVTRGH